MRDVKVTACKECVQQDKSLICDLVCDEEKGSEQGW